MPILLIICVYCIELNYIVHTFYFIFNVYLRARAFSRVCASTRIVIDTLMYVLLPAFLLPLLIGERVSSEHKKRSISYFVKSTAF